MPFFPIAYSPTSGNNHFGFLQRVLLDFPLLNFEDLIGHVLRFDIDIHGNNLSSGVASLGLFENTRHRRGHLRLGVGRIDLSQDVSTPTRDYSQKLPLWRKFKSNTVSRKTGS